MYYSRAKLLNQRQLVSRADILDLSLLSRREWLRMGRKVQPRSPARATVTDPYEIALYAHEQTKPYTPSPVTLAREQYWDLFVRGHNNGQCIHHAPETGWRTVDQAMSRANLRAHLLGSAVYGVLGGRYTRWGAIDLDYHDRDLDVFLAQLTCLLACLQGRDHWHVLAGANGVHLVQVLGERMELSVYRTMLRQRLRQLDSADLADRARACGMRPLAELEIYPDTAHGLRLPLAHGRIALLDRPLALVMNRFAKREVQDVVGYMRWLKNPEAQYMAVGDVVEQVRGVMQEGASKSPIRTSINIRSIRKHTSGMKGQYRAKLIDFWTGRATGDLNTYIALTARILQMEVSQHEAVEIITRYVNELPDQSFSARLAQGKERKVHARIRHTVRTVYKNNGGQPEPIKSTAKLDQTDASFRRRGFRVSDKSTWQGTRFTLPDWTEAERTQIAFDLAPILKCETTVAHQATRTFLGFVASHTGSEIPRNALPKILREYPEIKWGYYKKTTDYLAALIRMGWLYVRSQHYHSPDGKGRARGYGVGPALAHKVGRAKPNADLVEKLGLHEADLMACGCATV